MGFINMNIREVQDAKVSMIMHLHGYNCDIQPVRYIEENKYDVKLDIFVTKLNWIAHALLDNPNTWENGDVDVFDTFYRPDIEDLYWETNNTIEPTERISTYHQAFLFMQMIFPDTRMTYEQYLQRFAWGINMRKEPMHDQEQLERKLTGIDTTLAREVYPRINTNTVLDDNLNIMTIFNYDIIAEHVGTSTVLYW